MTLDPRETAERRAWRLASLLSDTAPQAEAVVRAVIDAQPAPERLPEQRLDRLVILRAREIVERPLTPRPKRTPLLHRIRQSHNASRGIQPTSTPSPQPPAITPDAGPAFLFSGGLAPVGDALRALRRQPREAWTLRELDNKDIMDIARAMDCSRTAAERHLADAIDTMQRALSISYDEAVRKLRERALALDPEPFLLRRRQHRARRLTTRLIVIALALIILAALALLIISIFAV
ncbi:MAG: hypothetical protein VYC34_03835 [Planctomycetota bacterium]|nr:hypothetical protein [Planctomycetota bacterium]